MGRICRKLENTAGKRMIQLLQKTRLMLILLFFRVQGRFKTFKGLAA